MKQSVIKELSVKELEERYEEFTGKLTQLRMSHAVSPLENPKKITAHKKIVARLITEMRKREAQDQ